MLAGICEFVDVVELGCANRVVDLVIGHPEVAGEALHLIGDILGVGAQRRLLLTEGEQQRGAGE
ncbi:MAG: hypothetical protein NVS3B18_16680 [Candidatus Dormibacteria bacterium]